MSEWMSDIKLYLLNTSALALSMTNLEVIFKILLLVISIGYTLNKWVLLRDNKKQNKNEGD
tara:strand:+ start:355 stop:537 length:183 start_codon:yes stop_codon:yes gene_type:complete